MKNTTSTDNRKLDADIHVKLFKARWWYKKPLHWEGRGEVPYKLYLFRAGEVPEGCEDVTDKVLSVDLSGLEFEGYSYRDCPHYSTDHNAAALVVEYMHQQDEDIARRFVYDMGESVPDNPLGARLRWDHIFFLVWQDPAIICRAALKALEQQR